MSFCFSQTTDLAIIVEAQDLNGNDVSQVHIYEEFQYLISISNSGNPVSNASFSQVINNQAEVISFESINAFGGATLASNLELSPNNTLTGVITEMPTSSSVEIRILLKAPLTLGGIATNAIVFPPDNTTDTNTSNNQSIISIEVTDVDIDFSVVIQQTSMNENTPISNWNETVTYQFTITNNSAIEYPIDAFKIQSSLFSPLINGEAKLQVQSIECIQSDVGAECPLNINISDSVINVGSITPIFNFATNIVFPASSSLTFEMVIRYLQPDCAESPDTIIVETFVELEINHENLSSNQSNRVTTILLETEECLLTDVAIETLVISPVNGAINDWGDTIILETTVTNFGPNPAPIRFFLQNISLGISSWNIIDVVCLEATGGINCNDITFSLSDEFWNSNNFTIPVGAVITTQTMLNYVEPECTPESQTYSAQIRSAINILTNDIIDIDETNNFDDDFIQLLPTDECPSSDLEVTKTQIFPELPIGSSEANPMEWQEITYEITVSNIGTEDTFMVLKDERLLISGTNSTAILQSLECVSATGGATCGNISISNIGAAINDNSESQVFWEIVEDDGWQMPSGSTITFISTIDWLPECNNLPIEVKNKVSVQSVIGAQDTNSTNNSGIVTSYFTPCVDLVVQTFPSSTAVSINSPFNWIVDITNSTTSSNATNVVLEDIVNEVFTVAGPITCELTSGIANCIPAFNIADNTITGVIPNMEAGSSIRITIPVIAPNFGGAFNNIVEAIPSPADNEEITPETNISISSVLVIAPTLTKSFNPETVFVNEESNLIFTVLNINTNPAQNGINFTDNLPSGLLLNGSPTWVESNGCTTSFLGSTNDTFVGVDNLTFPEGVSFCSFSVPVISNNSGSYINQADNFSNQANIDTSQASATLQVIEDTTNVDIEILKDVFPQEVVSGEEVTFTITATNIGSTIANSIEIVEELPSGYQLISTNSSLGNFSENIWYIESLEPNQSAELTINAKVLPIGNYVNVAILQSLLQRDRNSTNNEGIASITITNCLQIPQGFSPNLDGFNDELVIPCIDDYPENNIKIFNRYGTLLFEKNNYKNNWDGTANRGFPVGDKLPVGTYYCILTLESGNTKTEWVYLNY